MNTKEITALDVRNRLITDFHYHADSLKKNSPVSISKVTARVYLNEGSEKPFLVKARAYLRDFIDVDYIDSDETSMFNATMNNLAMQVEDTHDAWVTARQQKLNELRYEAARIGYELIDKEGFLL